MQVPYREGLVTHSDPESCASCREARCEALTGDREGRVLSRERQLLWGASVLLLGVGNIWRTASTRCVRTPRGRRPRANTEAPHAGTGRSHDWPRGWRRGPRCEPKGHDSDERSWEVGRLHSTEEAAEQCRWCATEGGGRGGKGVGQGERGQANQVRTQRREDLQHELNRVRHSQQHRPSPSLAASARLTRGRSPLR